MNQTLKRSFVGFHLTLSGVVFVQSIWAAYNAFTVHVTIGEFELHLLFT